MSGSIIGGVDSSIPFRAGQGVQQQNPLASDPGRFADTLNSINELRLFPLRQQSLSTGVQQQQTALETAQLQQRLLRLNSGVGLMLPLLLDKDGKSTTGVQAQDIARAIADASNPDVGLLTAGQGAALMQTLPDGGSDPVKNRQWLLQKYASVRAAAGQHEAALAQLGMTPATRVSGDQIISGGVAGPLTQQPGAFFPSGQPTQLVLSPGERATQAARPATQADIDAGRATTIGQPLYEPMEERLRQQGAAHLLGPVAGNGQPVGPQNQPRLTPPAASPAAPAAPASAAGPRPVVGGLAPGAETEMQASAQHYSVDNAAANTFRQRIFPLSQAAEALKTADTGPGSETVNHIKSFLLAQSPESLRKYLPGVDPDKIASYDEAVKYLANYAMQQPGAAQSDMHLGLAQVANASTHISNLAARQVVMNALGLERMRQAATLEFNATHPAGSGQQYDRWMSNFSSTNDPRGFSWDDQSPAQRDAALKTMSRADKERLARSVGLARKYELTGSASGQ